MLNNFIATSCIAVIITTLCMMVTHYIKTRPPAAITLPVIVICPDKVYNEGGNGAFLGHTVGFTGDMNGITREAAMRQVTMNGGRAYSDSLPLGCDMLVAGLRPDP